MIIRREKGVAALEFAIVLPVLVLLALGICQFGILFYNQQVLFNASREAARSGIVQRTNKDDGTPLFSADVVKDMLRDIVYDYVDYDDTEGISRRLITFGGGGAPLVVSEGVNGNFGDPLSVTVTYDYQFFAGASFFGLSPQYTLKGETWMQMEQVLVSGS
ncbi:MAG: TadE/TadG family type IV pilus assembly protein [Planctomycetota bacterium]